MDQKQSGPMRPERKPQGPLVVGVLGGIASGKSVVAVELAGSDGVLVDADREAHAVLASPEVRQLVSERFGPDVLDDAGQPDRAALARIVFRDPRARAALEGWIHPRVRDRIRAELEGAARAPIAVLDVPLLLENDAEHGLARACHVLVYVDTPLADRESRAAAARGWTVGEVARREAAQIDQDRKRAGAHHVVPNRDGLEQLRESARALRARLLAERT